MKDDYFKTEPKVITNSVIIAIYGYTLIVPPGPAHSLFFFVKSFYFGRQNEKEGNAEIIYRTINLHYINQENNFFDPNHFIFRFLQMFNCCFDETVNSLQIQDKKIQYFLINSKNKKKIYC